MKLSIHGRSIKEDAVPFVKDMFRHLIETGEELQVYGELFESLQQHNIITGDKTSVYHNPQEIKVSDFMISVGGDGTLLDALTFIGPRETPILGINTGRMGFLATTPRNEIITALGSLKEHKYRFDERSLLRLESDNNLFEDLNFALNEFAILKRDSSSMIVVHTYLNGDYLNSYWADGLLIATPTGSTGYSLSCGGPLVMPSSNNFVITPVNPHNLNVRPMIVPDNSELSFKIEGRSNTFLVSLDSRSKVIDDSVKLAIKKESFKARLLELEHSNFFKTLRSKLNWGLDMRN